MNARFAIQRVHRSASPPRRDQSSPVTGACRADSDVQHAPHSRQSSGISLTGVDGSLAAMPTVEKLACRHEGTELEAHLAIPGEPSDERLPTELGCHAFSGQSDLERGKAERLASELGYLGAALDLYGRGVRGSDPIESGQLMMPFTNPAADDHARGTVYEPRADRRSWIAMKSFLEEVLGSLA